MSIKDKLKLIVEERIVLQLYVSGMSFKSMEAIQNIKKLCNEHLHDAFELEIIDLYKNPEIASEQQIVFSPSLIKNLPLPRKVLIGTFADTAKVIKGLSITFKEDNENSTQSK
ncbi:MAG: circadian clock KaiB family protein [Flavobacteriales bacterium]|nr:circadian clock KaiB family protein [Flavobacteriales bacterium]